MLKNISELGSTLSKKEQKLINGGKKCETIPVIHDGIENSINGSTCMHRCRPSFLGIGLGSWSEWEEIPC